LDVWETNMTAPRVPPTKRDINALADTDSRREIRVS
jgi:hypothetical protein